ncbi:MAG: T9SS type A sorting domain-containing protein [Saprospiraceae bacterium]
MKKPCTFFRLIPFFALFVTPLLLRANGDPTGNMPNSDPVSTDSITRALALGHCNPITSAEINCTTHTIELSAWVLYIFSGQLVPYVAYWNTGETAHKITVVPPGAWSWDASATGCEPNHWQNEYNQPGAFFEGTLNITGAPICIGGSSQLNVTTGLSPEYNFQNFDWNPANPAGILTPYEIFQPGTYVLNVLDDLGCPFSDQIFIQTTSTPSYLLTNSVNSLKVCTGEIGSFTTDLTSICGFDSPITLSVTGAPPGATVNISPNPVMPTGVATVTLSGFTSGMIGNYTLIVKGVSGGNTQTATVALTVVPSLPGIPSPTSPANGETGVNNSTWLFWTAVPDASTYYLQVATNPSFSPGSIVSEQTVIGQTFTGVDLQADKVYYWRIRASNGCGVGNYSEVTAFQTGQLLCGFGPCVITYIEIDPNSVNTIQYSLDMPLDRLITDVDVNFRIGHTWVGDLSAQLVSPHNDNIPLFDRPGVPASQFGCNGHNLDLTFDSQAGLSAAALENQCNNSPPALNGTFRPIGSLNVLNGKRSKGDWTLFVTDNLPQDGGGLDKFCVSFCLDPKIPAGSILTNKLLTVSYGGSGFIDISKLKMATSGSAVQGQFIVLSTPVHGTLKLNNVALGVGGTFTQDDINNNKLVYHNNGDGALIDNFHFDALDQNNDFWVHNAVFNINIIGVPLTATATITNGICPPETTGEITVMASGGQLPYTYSLNGGPSQSSNVFSNLPPGSYTILVTDNSGGSAFTIQIVLPASPPVVPTLSGPPFMCPEGNTGIVQVNQPWNAYLWSSGETTNPIIIYEPGIYEVTVTNQFGCTGVGVIGVQSGEVSPFAISMTAPAICVGQMDTLKVLGSFVQYHWSNNVNTITNIVTQPGTYTLTVTNIYGCTGTGSVTIGLKPTPSIAITSTPFCAGGSSTLTVTGGTFANYLWLPGGQTTNPITVSTSGTYTVTVSGLTICATSTSITIMQSPSPTTVIAPPAQLSCANPQTVLNASSSSTGPNFTFVWSTVGGNFVMGQNTLTPTVNGTGTYTLQITNTTTGCTSSASVLVSSNIQTPPAPVGNPATLSCNVSNLTIGPAMPPTDPNLHPVWVATLGGNIVSGQNTWNPIVNQSGTYTLTVTNTINGCTATGSVQISQSPQIQMVVMVSGNTITIQASGGTGFLQYSIDGVNFQASNQFSNLPCGTYTATVRDANGCTATSQATVNILSGNFATPDIKCFGGSTNIIVQASCGTPPYQYKLGNGAYQSGNVFNNIIVGNYLVTIRDAIGATKVLGPIIVTQPTPLNVSADLICNDASLAISGGTPPYTFVSNAPNPDLKNLPNGTYQVTATDGNGCLATTTITVNVPLLGVSFTTDSVLCFGGNTGSITANGYGGCPPYQYSLNGSPFKPNSYFPNLSTTTYSLAVKDAKGAISFVFATVFQPAQLELTATVNANTITAIASGGTLPYKFSLNGGVPKSSGVFPNLVPGTYTVIAIDANGCTASTANIDVPTVSTIELTAAWGLTISPNPSTGLFTLTLKNAPDALRAEVLDVTGRLLQSLNLEPIGGQLTTSLDLHDLPQGTYMLKLSDGKNWGGARLIKVD